MKKILRKLYKPALSIFAVFMFGVDWFAAEYYRPVKRYTMTGPSRKESK